jgi:putative restriction endonuclease
MPNLPDTAAVVANTDNLWFSHFRPDDTLSIVDEVNFWRPLAQQRIRALPVGAPLFFRLKRPHSAIAGFGFFAGEYLLPTRIAWDMFGTKNGDPSYSRFAQRIEDYRRRLRATNTGTYTNLSCLVLRDAVFLPQRQWLRWQTEESWSPNIVSYKAYDLELHPGRVLAELMQGIHAPALAEFAAEFVPVMEDDRLRAQADIVIREGQGTFRLRMFDAYGWRCSVTEEHAVPVLDQPISNRTSVPSRITSRMAWYCEPTCIAFMTEVTLRSRPN